MIQRYTVLLSILVSCVQAIYISRRQKQASVDVCVVVLCNLGRELI